ncbi:MAG: PIN domain-containing protein [Candidatus Woesebacteria bacterium]|nr:PIN domain-containing protein [Candidatus Woesebacteria bacterium]
MKKYIVDTNIFIRFLLKDNEKFYQQAKKYFDDAKEKKIVLILISQVVFEIDYVLRSVYKLSHKESADILINLVKSSYLQVENRQVIGEAIEKYAEENIDLVDLFLIETARKEKVEILSFDKDFLRKNKLGNE